MAKRKRYEDQMLLAAGEQVPGQGATYVIERVAGMGSFGVVYLARDPALPDRRVALKEFLSPRHPRERAGLEALFERERTVGMQASPHPLMPTFYEAFFTDGHYYIAQEFIEGSTLDEIIFKRHPLPREWTLKWAVSLCDALAFLHSRGVVHHDLKPANIRISPQGHLTLLDFGAAQYFGAGHENTVPVEIYGTEGYLPPELEADGQWIADARTDIFALGAIVYEMIAGEAPSQEDINVRSMYVTNSLMQQPNADMGLIRLINKALSYNTEYRYATANDFLLEMRRIAPPVLLVSRKHMRYGEVMRGQPVAAQQVTLYNAGGGQIRGEIKPRAPWITASPSTFRSNQQDVTVTIDPTKISERGKMVSGRLEINTPDVLDADGKVVSLGDRWFVECSATILAGPGILAAPGHAGPGAVPVTLSARRGQTAIGSFLLRNAGETEIDFVCGKSSLAETTISPTEGRLAPGQALSVDVSVPTAGLAVGSHDGTLVIEAAADHALTVGFNVRVQSSLDALRSVFGKR